jgi:myo-inositol-1(or 4)-monophosphatase
MFNSQYTPIIEKACIKAGKIIKRDYGEVENLQISKKGPGNFVTSCDLKVEKILIEEIQKSFPKATIISEEAGLIKGEDKVFFIIDPIDGTTNFMHGLPFFGISIAVMEKNAKGNNIVVGAIYNPVFDEFYYAEKGYGAFCNNRRLFASGRKDYDEAVFAAYIARNNIEYRDRDIKVLTNLKIHTRIIGSAAMELAYTASGKLDGMWHFNLKPWDIAAGVLLVQEAKGMVSEINGGSKYLDSGNIIAANPNIFESLRKNIQKCVK